MFRHMVALAAAKLAGKLLRSDPEGGREDMNEGSWCDVSTCLGLHVLYEW